MYKKEIFLIFNFELNREIKIAIKPSKIIIIFKLLQRDISKKDIILSIISIQPHDF